MRPRVLLTDDRGSGPTVVLMPGGLTGWASWEQHQLKLIDRCRVIRVQPIHNELGSAGMPGDPSYTAEVERESLRMTLEQLRVEDAALAGWSRGGGSAIEYTMEYPSHVRTLTLIEPEVPWALGYDAAAAAGPRDQELVFLDAMVGKDVTEDDLAQFLVVFGLVESLEQARNHPMWDRWVKHRNALSWPYQAAVDPSRSVADLAAIDCPVLLIKGSKSTSRDRAMVDALGRHFPNADIAELEGGHASHVESIDAFLAAFEVQIRS